MVSRIVDKGPADLFPAVTTIKRTRTKHSLITNVSKHKFILKSSGMIKRYKTGITTSLVMVEPLEVSLLGAPYRYRSRDGAASALVNRLNIVPLTLICTFLWRYCSSLRPRLDSLSFRLRRSLSLIRSCYHHELFISTCCIFGNSQSLVLSPSTSISIWYSLNCENQPNCPFSTHICLFVRSYGRRYLGEAS